MFSYKEALEYLDSLINYEKRVDFSYNRRLFNLKRMRNILRELDNPHLRLKTIHVAGTKGKGSTAAMIASILTAGGYRVGLYTSPHLISPRERIRIGQRFIREEEFSSSLVQIKSAVEKISHKKRFFPTFFEVYTAMAFLYFFQRRVDIAVIEVGLGGRLDATNVIEPLIGIITPISFDHTKQLGNEITSIAREIAGIIKPNCKIVVSTQESSVSSLLQTICRERRATLYRVGKDVRFNLLQATPRYQRFRVQGLYREYPSLFLPLGGEHQLWNAATAIATVELLKDQGFPVSPGCIERGLRRVDWPGRAQILSQRPILMVDCAHNGASAQALAKFLKNFYPEKKLVLILAILKNKDIRAIGEALCPLANQIIITRVKSPRALSPEEIWSKIKMYCSGQPIIEKNVELALGRAKELARRKGLICVSGSVYLVGEVLNLVKKGIS